MIKTTLSLVKSAWSNLVPLSRILGLPVFKPWAVVTIRDFVQKGLVVDEPPSQKRISSRCVIHPNGHVVHYVNDSYLKNAAVQERHLRRIDSELAKIRHAADIVNASFAHSVLAWITMSSLASGVVFGLKSWREGGTSSATAFVSFLIPVAFSGASMLACYVAKLLIRWKIRQFFP